MKIGKCKVIHYSCVSSHPYDRDGVHIHGTIPEMDSNSQIVSTRNKQVYGKKVTNLRFSLKIITMLIFKIREEIEENSRDQT